MSTWTKRKLADCVTFQTGKLNSNAAVVDGAYPFFTCSQEIYKTNTWSFDTECVLLGGNNASAIYPIFYFKGKFDAYQRTYVIEPKNNNHIRYFYYLLREKLEELRKQSTGATTKFLTIKILHNINVSIPDASEQQAIASVLSAYDDLIENNEKRTRILEEMAERLYHKWFVKFKFPGHESVRFVDSGTEFGEIPEGWEHRSLNDISNIVFGFNFKSKGFKENGEGIRVVRIRDVLDGITNTFTTEEVDKKYEILPGDLLIGMDGIFHMQMWYMEKCFLNQRVAGVRSDIPTYFLSESIKNQLYKLQKIIVGSTVGHLSNGNIKEFKIPTPLNKDLLSPFEYITKTIINIKLQNQNLSKTRDLLIPRLVTGKRELKKEYAKKNTKHA